MDMLSTAIVTVLLNTFTGRLLRQ